MRDTAPGSVLHRTPVAIRLRRRFRAMMAAFARAMPKGLYARSLLIIVTPIVLLQSVLVFVFMERHRNSVTQRLSQTFAADVALVLNLYEADGAMGSRAALQTLVRDKLGFEISFLPQTAFRARHQHQATSLVHRSLGKELQAKVRRPFRIIWPNTSADVTVQVLLADTVLQAVAHRSRTYASNSHIFIVWMVGTSLVLLSVALMFLHNQIRPIQSLAVAAERFGLGRPESDYRPRGAREVRQAGHAFIKMRNRIERQLEQRTIMLAGISHDLKTILTRFRLNLALLERSDDVDALIDDADEMERMLDGYMTFAREDETEKASLIDLAALLDEIRTAYESEAIRIFCECRPAISAHVQPIAFRRCMINLVANACRHARSRVEIMAVQKQNTLIVFIDDDGPGIDKGDRGRVFRPFQRLDEARTIEDSGSGLGLTIARDIIRRHGGDILLGDSPLGGLRVDVTMPVV